MKKEGKWWEAGPSEIDGIIAYIESLEDKIQQLEKQIIGSQYLPDGETGAERLRIEIRLYSKVHLELTTEESVFLHLWALGYNNKSIETLIPTLRANHTTIHRRICSAVKKIKGMILK